jgi:hypothetical protein
MVEICHHSSYIFMEEQKKKGKDSPVTGPPLWSSGQSSWLQVRVLFLALPDFLRSSGSGTGSVQSLEYN